MTTAFSGVLKAKSQKLKAINTKTLIFSFFNCCEMASHGVRDFA